MQVDKKEMTYEEMIDNMQYLSVSLILVKFYFFSVMVPNITWIIVYPNYISS